MSEVVNDGVVLDWRMKWTRTLSGVSGWSVNVVFFGVWCWWKCEMQQ